MIDIVEGRDSNRGYQVKPPFILTQTNLPLNLCKLLCGGSGCGSVSRAVASNTRGPRFKSSHRQKLIFIEHLFTVNCILKRRKMKKKRPGMAHF